MSAVIDITTVIATTLEWLIGLGLAILVPIIGAWVLVRRKDTKGWSRTQWFLALMWHWVFLTVPWWFLWGAIVATAFRIDDPSGFGQSMVVLFVLLLVLAVLVTGLACLAKGITFLFKRKRT